MALIINLKIRGKNFLFVELVGKREVESMDLEKLISEGDNIRDNATEGAMSIGKSVDMEELATWVTKVMMYMDRNIEEEFIIDSLRTHSHGITSNTAYNKLIMILGTLKGYKESI